MKKVSRYFLAVIAITLAMSMGPAAAAATPRDGRGIDVPAKIAKIIAKLHSLFSVGSQSDALIPPRP